MTLFLLGLTIGIAGTLAGFWYGSSRYLKAVDR